MADTSDGWLQNIKSWKYVFNLTFALAPNITNSTVSDTLNTYFCKASKSSNQKVFHELQRQALTVWGTNNSRFYLSHFNLMCSISWCSPPVGLSWTRPRNALWVKSHRIINYHRLRTKITLQWDHKLLSWSVLRSVPSLIEFVHGSWFIKVTSLTDTL